MCLIKIGKTYSVRQRARYTFVQTEIFVHGMNTKVSADSVWRSDGFLVKIMDETERKHLQNAVFIESENEDPEDFRSDIFSNIEFQDSYNGTVPFLTCVGDGWKSEKQKEVFIKRYKDALEDEDEDFGDVGKWLSEQGFTSEENMYYIEDGVKVRLMSCDDKLRPMN